MKQPEENLKTFYLDFAHNDYLQFIVEVGIGGALLIFCFLMFVLVFSYLAYKKLDKLDLKIELSGTFFAILLPALHATLSFPFHMPALCLVFVIALSLHIRTLSNILK